MSDTEKALVWHGLEFAVVLLLLGWAAVGLHWAWRHREAL